MKIPERELPEGAPNARRIDSFQADKDDFNNVEEFLLAEAIIDVAKHAPSTFHELRDILEDSYEVDTDKADIRTIVEKINGEYIHRRGEQESPFSPFIRPIES